MVISEVTMASSLSLIFAEEKLGTKISAQPHISASLASFDRRNRVACQYSKIDGASGMAAYNGLPRYLHANVGCDQFGCFNILIGQTGI